MIAVAMARQESLSFSSSEWVAEPDLSGFKDYQRQTAQELFDWLKAGPGAYGSTGIRTNAVRVLKGCAGSGKSYLTKSLLQEFRRCCPGPFVSLFAVGESENDSAAIRGCAPTGQASRVLEDQDAPFDSVSTIASLFGIRPKPVQLTPKNRAILRALEAKLTTSPLDEAEKIQLECLRWTRELEDQQEVQFLPTGDPCEALQDVRLLCVDECGMIDKATFSILVDILNDPNGLLRPDFQVLFIGDPEQCAPVGEIASLVFGFPCVTPLTEVSRFGGLILNLSVAVRTPGTNLPRTIDDFIGLSLALPEEQLPEIDGFRFRPIEACREREAYFRMAELLKGGETARWIAPTNAAVLRINSGVQRALTGCETLDYRPGNKLLTLTAVTRGPQQECRYMKRDSRLVVPNSEVVVVTGVKPLPPHSSGFGRFEVSVSWPGGSADLFLVDPNQAAKLPHELSRLAERAKAFSRDPKVKPGSSRATKIDEIVFQLWLEMGISSWAELSPAERHNARNREWVKYHSLRTCCDDVTYASASTVIKGQGAQYQSLFLSFQDFFGGRMGPDYGRGTTWNVAAMLYTAITRAQQQLTFVF